jgi:hypothetical protein
MLWLVLRVRALALFAGAVLAGFLFVFPHCDRAAHPSVLIVSDAAAR